MLSRFVPSLLALAAVVVQGCDEAPSLPSSPAVAETPIAPPSTASTTPAAASSTPGPALAPGPTPTVGRAAEVVAPTPRATLVAGYDHTCALVTGPGIAGPQVKCWGSNADGELGLGDTKARGVKPRQMGDRLPVVALPEGAPIVALAATHHRTCALRADGKLYCWGSNEDGELGLGDEVSRGGKPGEIASLAPVDLPGPVVSMSIGEMHACAVLEGGGVVCRGANYDGLLGLGDRRARGGAAGELGASLPRVDLGAGLRAREVRPGSMHTCALFEDDATLVKCWGAGMYGTLGLADTHDRGREPGQMGDALPRVELGTGFRVATLSAGHGHTCALSTDHRVKCWGNNHSGQLGQGHFDSPGGKPGQSRVPAEMGDALPFVDLGRDLEVIAVAAGNSHNCAILRRPDASTGLKCWGMGALGLGSTTQVGGRAAEMGDALPFVDLGRDLVPVALALGSHTCVVVVDRDGPATEGRVKCWGTNEHGNLGRGDTEYHTDRVEKMGDALPFVDLGTEVRVVVAAPR